MTLLSGSAFSILTQIVGRCRLGVRLGPYWELFIYPWICRKFLFFQPAYVCIDGRVSQLRGENIKDPHFCGMVS